MIDFPSASVAADALIRNDMAKTIALGVDHAGLYGAGNAQPKGLTLYTGSNEVVQYKDVTPAPKGIGANGNTLRPEDGYRMIGLIEDRNFEFEGWIFRPTMANNVQGYRADAAAPADAAGAFVPGGVDNSAVCVNFTVTAGELKTFTVDNTPPPGGDARTIGYWKTHASCSTTGARKRPKLDQTLAAAEPTGIRIGDLVLHGSTSTPNTAPDCLKATRILNKSRIDNGAKMA